MTPLCNLGGGVTVKRVKIHYRRLVRNADIFPAGTLRDRIAAAMDTTLPNGTLVRQRASNRLAPVPGQAGYERMLNTYHEEGQYVFGTVCLFSPGQLQALLKVADEGEGHQNLADVLEQLEIAETAAPTAVLSNNGRLGIVPTTGSSPGRGRSAAPKLANGWRAGAAAGRIETSQSKPPVMITPRPWGLPARLSFHRLSRYKLVAV